MGYVAVLGIGWDWLVLGGGGVNLGCGTWLG
jgi:hypothetical protein